MSQNAYFEDSTCNIPFPVHFGMGDHPRADLVEIRWPSGQLDHYAEVPVNSFYLAREADGLKPDPSDQTRAPPRITEKQALNY